MLVLAADNLAYGNAERPGDGTQGFQTRIGAGIVFQSPNRMRGHAHSLGEMLLAHSGFYAEPSDYSTLACALLRGFDHFGCREHADPIAAMKPTGSADVLILSKTRQFVNIVIDGYLYMCIYTLLSTGCVS